MALFKFIIYIFQLTYNMAYGLVHELDIDLVMIFSDNYYKTD